MEIYINSYKGFKKTTYSIGKSMILMELLILVLGLIVPKLSAGSEYKFILYSSLTTTLAYIICFLIFLKKDRYPLKWNKTSSFLKTILIGIGLMMSVNILVSFLSLGLNQIFETDSIDAEFLASGNSFLDLITTGILPGIGEELVFRGIAFRYLRKYNLNIAIIGSSLLFGLAHMNLTQGIFAFLAGLILSYSYEKTGSIFTPIIIHIANNSIASLSITFPIFNMLIIILVIISSFYLIFKLILLTIKRRNRINMIIENNKNKFNSKLFKSFILNPLILVYGTYCLIYLIIMLKNGIL